MYGYATNETEELMPLTIILAHKLNKQLADFRRDGTLPWVRPDSKTQVCKMECKHTYMISSLPHFPGHCGVLSGGWCLYPPACPYSGGICTA